MKAFLQIVTGAVLAFLALSMIQEKETFAANWFRAPEPFRADEAQQRQVTDAVHSFRTLAAHWYGTRGDRRFGERLPASPAVVEELASDIAYMRANGRTETPRLVRLDVLSCALQSEDAAEVVTREYWVTEFHWLEGGSSDAPRSDLLHVKYSLARDGARWIVVSWDPVAPPEEKTS